MVRPGQVPAVLPAASRGSHPRDGAGRTLRRSRLLSGEALKSALRERSRSLGFDALRITSTAAIPALEPRLAEWLAAGHHGSMEWMAERRSERAAPEALWSAVRSVVIVGVSYAPDEDPLSSLSWPDRAAIATYARRRDYHDVVKGKLKELGGYLAARAEADVKVFVDTAPVMEKPLAAAAGIGWQGKHTVLVSRDFGNWLLLGAIFTSAVLPPDEAETEKCGTCRRCLDICPTNAFPAPFQLDSRRCISYLTIEHKGHIPSEFREPIGNRVFGCDDCLAVCPWNKFAGAARDIRLAERADLSSVSLAELSRLDDAGFRARFAGTPIKRTGRDRFMRNVLIAIGNSRSPDLAAEALRLAADPSPLVRAMAAWAIGRLLPHEAASDAAARHLPSEADPAVREEWERLRHTAPEGATA